MMNAHLGMYSYLFNMMHLGGVIHQPYLTLWGVEAQRTKVRS